ncbi:MAG: asparaginase [Deltaproteobacteria bacterium]|nr:MAG: asparaginase [Deltaproteobacteria bacterium]
MEAFDQTDGTLVQIFTTGGTIDKVYFDGKSRYEVGETVTGRILNEANIHVAYDLRMLMKKDSLDMDDEDRAYIADAVRGCEASRILITHGTDTMVETGKAIGRIPDKVVVMTGSMAPARFKESDAVFNVGFAMAAVQTLPPGVYVAMNGRIFHATACRKNVAAGRFESTSD